MDALPRMAGARGERRRSDRFSRVIS
jgi:hypothetical protein